jgi:A/G-specific adenine glycosylase
MLKYRIPDFSSRLLAWFDLHGRKALPWQQRITPYRVWVSEIMLQQTQVNTVISYYQRFMRRFPSLRQLAEAQIDEVLHHWSGLGYYARGRNLHKTAQIILSLHGGRFPRTLETLLTMPGIGRSTAGAILSIACQTPTPILDGNVKRVLARAHAISGWPDAPKVQKILWPLAEAYTPQERAADYTQAMMDLGATVCTRTKPKCLECPLKQDCLAKGRNEIAFFPGKKEKKVLPEKQSYFAIIRRPDGAFLLEKRPSEGIWGGLWSFPEFSIEDQSFIKAMRERFPAWKFKGKRQALDSFTHTFSHFHLTMFPTIITLDTPIKSKKTNHRWIRSESDLSLGLPAPIATIIRKHLMQF